MGAFDGDELRYVGSVGTGFTDRTLALLKEKLEPLSVGEPSFKRESLAGERKNLKNVKWVRPKLVAVIEFRQATATLKLRAPSFKGLREDKSPKDCLIEQLHAAR